MKREFLEGLGIEKDVVDKIMAEHGTTMQSSKTEIDEFKAQIKERDDDLKNLNKQLKDVEGVPEELKTLKEKYETAKTETESKVKQLKFDYALEQAITKSGARNPKAVRGMLESDKLEFGDDESIKGLEEQIKGLQESDAYLFNKGTSTGGSYQPNGGQKTPPAQATSMTEALQMTITENN